MTQRIRPPSEHAARRQIATERKVGQAAPRIHNAHVVGSVPNDTLFSPVPPVGWHATDSSTGITYVRGIGGVWIGTSAKSLIAKIHQSGAQAAPAISTWTILQYNVTDFNTGAFTFFGAPVTGILIPVTGKYRIHGQVATIANSQTFIAALVVNNTGAGTGHAFADGTTYEAYTGATDSNGVSFPTLTLLAEVALTAADKVGMEWFQGTAAPQAGVAGRTSLSVERIG